MATVIEAPAGRVRRRLLVVASIPSDFNEMYRLAEALGKRGHDVVLQYHYRDASIEHHQAILDRIDALTLTTSVTSIEPVPYERAVLTDASARFQSFLAYRRTRRKYGHIRVPGKVRSLLLRQTIEEELPTVVALATRVARPFSVEPEGAPWGVRLLRRLMMIVAAPFLAALHLFSVGETKPENSPLFRPKGGWGRAARLFHLARSLVRGFFAFRYEVMRFVRMLILLWAGLTDRLWRTYVRPPLLKPIKYLFLVYVYKSWQVYFRRVMRKDGYEAVLTPEDIVGPMWPSLVKAAHALNRPVIIVPYTIANQQEAFQGVRFNDDYQSSAHPWVARLFPRWRKIEGDVDILRLPGPHIIAHEVLGLTPPDPWMMNSGYANAIAVENRAMRGYYLKAGIPDSKLRVVGTVIDDQLYEGRRNRDAGRARLDEELHLDPTLPILLLGGCPNQLAGTVPFCEFESMEELIDHLAEALVPLRNRYAVVVRPHPNYPELADMMRRHGYAATMTDTGALVPLADLYVAFASATIRWAIACGIPTVNYDVFNYDYDDFATVGGVFNVRKKDDFARVIASLDPEGAAYRAAVDRLATESVDWGFMDGCCVERMEALVEEFCLMPRVPRTTR